MKNKTPVIAIDGHAGAGKSTVADLVATELGFWHVNTGLYYRAVTWLALQEQCPVSAQAKIEDLARSAEIEVQEDDGHQDVFVNRQKITDQVRTPDINRHISQISAYAGVRHAITSRLQALQHPQGIIMDGRDIGTVVFPQAALKIFLTASVEERARRQHADSEAQGHEISLQEFRNLVADRDRKDSERAVAPLMEAEDAVHLDSTGRSPEEIAQKIMQLWRARQVA